MDHNAFDARRRSLEEAFFSKQNQALIDKLHAAETAKHTKDELQAITGLRSEAVLDALLKQGLTVKTMAALALVPLVTVAWADGQMEPKERTAILKAADERGVSQGTDAYQLLDRWLADKPAQDVLTTWKQYVSALKDVMSGSAYAELRDHVLASTREVADAAGGLLGIGSISAKEKAVISELESAFS